MLVAGLGLVVARRLGLPGGPFTGAMLATATAALLDAPLAEPPGWLRTAARTVLGLTIGASVTGQTLRSIAGVLAPAAAMIVVIIAAGVLVAWLMSRWARVDLSTALCGAAPGVLTAMVALTDDLGGDGRAVASLHLVRLISVLLLVPALAHAIFPAAGAAPVAASAGADAVGLARLACLLVLGLGAALVALRLRVPAGDLLAGLAVAALANPLWLHLGPLPGGLRLFSQWVIGAGVGATVTRRVLRDFRPLAVAGALMTAFLIGAGLALAWALARLTSLDPVTCLVATAPGGADQMVILADELGGNAQLVAAIHILRQIALLLLLPPLVRLAGGRARRQVHSPAGACPNPPPSAPGASGGAAPAARG